MYWDNWMLEGGKESGKPIYGRRRSLTDSTETEFALTSLKSAFMSALLETGLRH